MKRLEDIRRKMGKYDDIINMKPHVSKNHKPMSMQDRAAQFSPFAALDGHAQSIMEQNRIVDRKIELTNEQKLIINKQLNYLSLLKDALVTITYFIKDSKKEGGTYCSEEVMIKRIDEYNRMIICIDKKISFDDIYQIMI